MRLSLPKSRHRGLGHGRLVGGFGLSLFFLFLFVQSHLGLLRLLLCQNRLLFFPFFSLFLLLQHGLGRPVGIIGALALGRVSNWRTKLRDRGRFRWGHPGKVGGGGGLIQSRQLGLGLSGRQVGKPDGRFTRTRLGHRAPNAQAQEDEDNFHFLKLKFPKRVVNLAPFAFSE